MTAESGLLVVDKPAGLTSHQVVGRVRRLLGTRKVGHAGTLDPMATGVLLVGVNRATRLLGHLALHDKRYLATMRLGIATLTDDAEGDVVASPGLLGVDLATVREAAVAFTLDILQSPSSVSAIKVDGRRSYARVRAGEDVVLPPRPVHVSRLDVLGVRSEVVGTPDGDVAVLDVDVDVECSSGTYIRALARDIGLALGSAGHLTVLRRTRVGPFLLSEAVSLDAPSAPALLSMAEAARRTMPTTVVSAAQAVEVSYGRALDLTIVALTGVIGPDGDLLALYEPDGADARPQTVFSAAGS